MCGWMAYIILLYLILTLRDNFVFVVFPASCAGNIPDHLGATLEICVGENISSRKILKCKNRIRFFLSLSLLQLFFHLVSYMRLFIINHNVSTKHLAVM